MHTGKSAVDGLGDDPRPQAPRNQVNRLGAGLVDAREDRLKIKQN
jgi:hypothetical protein